MSSLSPLAPVAADGLSRALLPFGQSTMLPVESYTSQAVLDWERRHFVAGSWACVGRVEELRTDGATSGRCWWATCRCCSPSTAATIRAFANTCRHRAHVLLEDDQCATTKSVLCVYHAWTYRLDGTLQGAPGFRDNEFFDKADYGLVPLPSREWHGWLFVNATGDAPPFDDHLGAIEELVGPYAPERLVLRARHTYEIAANWKLVSENYHECYHCPLIHPELCQVSIPPRATTSSSRRLDRRHDVFKDGSETMSLDGGSKGRPIEGAPQDSVLYVQLFPNLLISGHPDYVMTHRVLPLAPDRTWIECSWYFPGSDIDPTYAVEFWDLTNSQDWRACELVQRGLTSPHFAPGPFSPSEDAVHQWVQMVGRGYLGVDPHDKPEHLEG